MCLQVFDLSRSWQSTTTEPRPPASTMAVALGKIGFLAVLFASTTVEKAEAMVLSIGTQMASTLPDITDTVEAISFVEGTE